MIWLVALGFLAVAVVIIGAAMVSAGARADREEPTPPAWKPPRPEGVDQGRKE